MTNDQAAKNIAAIIILVLLLDFGAGLVVGIATGSVILGLLVGSGVAAIAMTVVLVVEGRA
jgi:hypothetical protein